MQKETIWMMPAQTLWSVPVMDYYDKLGDWNEETLCFLSVQVPQGQQKAKTDEQLYQAAVWDAVTIEAGDRARNCCFAH